MRYMPKETITMLLKPKHAVNHIVGNFLILGLSGNGRVKAKCLLCGNDKYEGQFYKVKSGTTVSCGCKHKIINPEQYVGKVYGKLTMLRVVQEKYNGAIQAKFQCVCGTKTIKVLNAVQRGRILSCGCGGKTRGGLSANENKRYYSIWRQMLGRCYMAGKHVTDDKQLQFLNNTKEHPRYKDYGARGLGVASEWHSLDRFISWYKANIKPGESMDRVDNNKGYSPENVKSATDKRQSINQRIRKDNTTGYKGIRILVNGYAWTVKNNGVTVAKQVFRTVEQAIIERNIYIIVNEFSHDIQAPDYTHNVQITGGSDTGYVVSIKTSDNGLIFNSVTTWTDKNDPVLLKVVKAMQDAYTKKYALAK